MDTEKTIYPFTTNWIPSSFGTSTIVAVARDASGNYATSSSVSIFVLAPPIQVSPSSSASTLATSTPALQISTSTPIFTQFFSFGTQHDEIKKLQEYLSQDKAIYPEAIITGYYSSFTQKAIERFQCKHNIVCSGDPETTGYGFVGPKTKDKLNEIFGKTSSVQTSLVQTSQPSFASASSSVQTSPSSSVSASVSAVFIKGLRFGMKDAAVKRLQQLLNSDPETRVASSGFGSPGNETEYFGSLLERAVQKFQCKHNIVCAGTPKTTGYGFVGPKTRGKIIEVFGGE